MDIARSEVHDVSYGRKRIYFELKRRDRKTISITVRPDLSVVVAAPLESAIETVKERVAKRSGWIAKQQLWFAGFMPRTPERRYLGGETHLYLGKPYRLRIIEGEIRSVSLNHGFLEVAAKGKPSPKLIKGQLDAWYRERANKLFLSMTERQAHERGISNTPKVFVKKMKTHWGSMSNSGNMTLNPNLIMAPKACIDYVICHELCHIRHPNHDKGFFELLSSLMPDWEKRKQVLEQALK
jgi:predicted metal-dependent hydrolase